MFKNVATHTHIIASLAPLSVPELPHAIYREVHTSLPVSSSGFQQVWKGLPLPPKRGGNKTHPKSVSGSRTRWQAPAALGDRWK